VAQADYVKSLKTSSNGWLKTKGVEEFSWQGGYGAFSVSKELIPVVRKYIENQEDHHRKFDFKAEFRALLEEHGMTWDERYVWD
jgi:putative transposase